LSDFKVDDLRDMLFDVHAGWSSTIVLGLGT
jgi:hypothetical protein